MRQDTSRYAFVIFGARIEGFVTSVVVVVVVAVVSCRFFWAAVFEALTAL